MRTTLDLPDALVQEAMQVTRIKTKKQFVTRALEELIKRERLSELKQYQRKIGLNIDLARKMLAHPVAVSLNLSDGRQPLQFDGLLQP